MKILGISAGFHDAAATVLQDGNILFAGHAERYSKLKNDADIHPALIQDVLAHAHNIDHVAYYERPWLKQLRQWYAGQGIEWDKITLKQVLEKQVPEVMQYMPATSTHNHHLCHAAAGFQTSLYDRATVVVIDAVGEFDTITIWAAEYDSKGMAKYRKLWSQRYPHSIGLFYSAATSSVGLRPLDEEYILMGMAAYGNATSAAGMQKLVEDSDRITFCDNLHTGIDSKYLQDLEEFDIAAGAQSIAEQLINSVMRKARDFKWSGNLVYMGGVALNCSANRNLGKYFDNIWIMPCPGDAGSSLGAAALAYGKQIHWKNANLGGDIPGAYPVADIVSCLLRDKIVGVASGRAEFGPRALGNRSLLADPRAADIKDRVNDIKRRQQFRPFAPVILEEHVDMYFDMPRGFYNSRYMQVIARCRHPHIFPAIVHRDGTSRVQTVPKDGSGIRQLLEAWYRATGCPMLLNTSLNIRGEPMVNDRADADRFEQLYRVKVCS